MKQERLTYNKPEVNNERQIRIKFNKEITKEVIYNYLLYKKDKRLEIFFEIFNSKKNIIRVEGQNVIVANLLKLDM